VKPSASHHQLDLQLSGDATARMVKASRAANKRRGEAISIALGLPLKERYFLPLAGVPKTRGDCPPPSEYCRYIRCRYHLAMIDAEHRAGRPGLASVPRDARGLTVPVLGDLGGERPGTSFDPRWLELERACKVSMEKDSDGKMVGLTAVHEGELDLFLERLHVGEPIDVVDGHLEKGQAFAALKNLPRVMGARLAPTGSIAFEREPSGAVTSYVFTLVRVRGVESCALHAIDKAGGRAMSNQESGDALARHRTLIAREARNAGRKIKRAAERLGIDVQDVMAALTRMGSGNVA
jgi:hypothetical protein